MIIAIILLTFVECDGKDNTDIPSTKATITTVLEIKAPETEVVVTEETTVPETTTTEPVIEPVTEATTPAPPETTTEGTTALVTEDNWLGAPEIVPDITNTVDIQTPPPAETDPSEKVGSIDPMTGKEVTVIKVKEGVNGTGQRYIRTYYSDGTTSSVVECAHCHKMPCPNGGGDACPEYDVKKDSTITCQQCGKPMGDGHNGTCYGEIDWANGGKLTCHHYD